MSAAAPSVTAVVPTYNNEATLGTALESLARQRYAGTVDVVCIDGGSSDATRDIAAASGARVVENPARREEEGRAIGLEAASGDLVLLLDADNEISATDWLERLVAAIDLAPDVISADCLFHEWRAHDPPVTRVCALIGGTDPLAIDLGWGDRWAAHLGRWTGADVVVEKRDDGILLVRIDPERPPPMGSNGYLVDREALLRTEYRPFVHSDVVGDLAAAGYRFAKVPEGIVHHYAPTLRAYARKAVRRARRSIKGDPPQRRGLQASPLHLAFRALLSLTVVHPVLVAMRGYRAHPDRAWALYPLLCLITTSVYVVESLRALVRGEFRKGAGEADGVESASISEHAGLISVVIPAYNEAEQIEHCLHDTHATLRDLGVRFEIIVVDDGSYDATLSLARLAAEGLDGVRVVGYPENLGKGFALIEGAADARGDLILFVDADLEVHPRQIEALYATLAREGADVVIGSKLHGESTIDYPLRRRILSLGYFLFVRILFRLPIHDTQTGLKLYRTEVLRRVAGRILVKRFAFDLEALVNAHHLGYKIAEAPVTVTRERPYPRVGSQDALHVARDTLAIWYRLYIRRWYDKVGEAADEAAASGKIALAPEGTPADARAQSETLAGAAERDGAN
jgi:glycosyltransferase involved in cell wall biosynthesis